jgi:hypothetical protein
MKKDTLFLFGLIVLLITVCVKKKYGFNIIDIVLNLITFSVSLLSFIYCIWYKKAYNHNSKLIYAGLINLITCLIISKFVFFAAFLGYSGVYFYYSRKKIVGFTDVDPEMESYLAVIKKNEMFFTKIPLCIAIGLYSIAVLVIGYKTLL